jgi:hypothetical protein
MSENVLSVIPADPHWQPGRDAADAGLLGHAVRQVMAHI